MRLVSPYTVLCFVIVWTVVFLLASRHFLFSAHQVNNTQSAILTCIYEISSSHGLNQRNISLFNS